MSRFLWYAMGSGVVCASSFGANLVVDGSFETPAVVNTGAGFDAVPAGGTIGPWTVGGAGVIHVGSFGRPGAVDGAQSVELNFFEGGSVEQSLAVTAGTAYTLSFLMAGQTDVGPDLKTLDLFWEGNNAGAFSWNRATEEPWQMRSINLTATGTSASLRFLGTVQVDGGPYIDAVSLGLAPEPASAFAASALPLLAARRRRA